MKTVLSDKLTAFFPVTAIGASILAWLYPQMLSEWKPAIIPLLSLIMFGMGMTLHWTHFLAVVKRPEVIGVTVLSQFFVMPLSAYYISKILGLSQEITVGMVLVGASAGGTASNVICYLAKGDVALSILLTTCSTLIAVFATPALSYFYLNESVPVPVTGMLSSILKIVLIPVLIGTALNTVFARPIARIRPVFPLISSLSIVVIIAIIVAVNHGSLSTVGPLIGLAVILHNLTGLGFGYLIARAFGYESKVCRTISIEVGMQNSGLSVALAVGFFTPLTALPGAVFSIWHNISGAILASYWGKTASRNNSTV